MSPSADRSGGWRWHLRAFQRRNGLWQPFRDEVARFLSRWEPATRSLILVGPSAGWCLPQLFLRRFDRLIIVDPDPWARRLFPSLHPTPRAVQWVGDDFFAAAPALLAAEPDAAVLFCNMLGQLRFSGLDEAAVEARIDAVGPLLQGRPWASFHELLSGETSLSPRSLPLAGRPHGEALLKQLGLSGPWLDHLTANVFPPARPRDIVPWRFAKGRVHLVEMGIGGERGPLTAQPS